MRTKISLTTLSLLLCIVASAPRAAEESTESAAAPVDFAREILPILSNKCFVCHGPDAKRKNILRLDSFAGATRDLGGYRAIDPGAPEDSEILVRIDDPDDPMPPKEADKKLSPGGPPAVRSAPPKAGVSSPLAALRAPCGAPHHGAARA